MKEKCVTFCFITLNAKISQKSLVEGWVFFAEVRSLPSKFIFTHFVSCWNRIAKQFKTLDPRKWEYMKAIYLSFNWVNYSWTRGFELVTRGFGLVTHEFELVTRGFELVTPGFEFVTSRFQLALFNFNLGF